jgi:hypothetical protein
MALLVTRHPQKEVFASTWSALPAPSMAGRHEVFFWLYYITDLALRILSFLNSLSESFAANVASYKKV